MGVFFAINTMVLSMWLCWLAMFVIFVSILPVRNALFYVEVADTMAKPVSTNTETALVNRPTERSTERSTEGGASQISQTTGQPTTQATTQATSQATTQTTTQATSQPIQPTTQATSMHF